MICSDGSIRASTSWPTAFSSTRAMKSVTTVKLTSASSSARRTSRRPSRMLSAVSRPRPRSFLRASPRGRVFLNDFIRSGGSGVKGVERTFCFDQKSGAELWKHEYPVEYRIQYPAGPRCTPTVDGDRVYTLGAVGHLFCHDAATGKVIWS